MMTRLRVVLPPNWALITFVGLFALLEGPYLYLEWQIQQPLLTPRPSIYFLRMTAIAYGVWRLWAFHPACRFEYRSWLERTPWISRKPLPAGPIALSWEDILPIGALVIPSAIQWPSGPLIALGLFLLGYLIALAASSWATRTGGFGYALLFGVGLIIRQWPDPRAFLASAIAVYAVGWVGLKVALTRFPWSSDPDQWTSSKKTINQEQTCGWPFDQLHPQIAKGPKLGPLNGLRIGLLVGWFLYAAEALLPKQADREVMGQLTFSNGVLFLAGFRTLIYCGGYPPPINIWGRIRTFHWIIPGYDQVFLAPFCTILVGVLAFDRFRPHLVSDEIFFPAALTVAVVVTLTTGPSLIRWRLTGRHRISASLSSKAGEFVKVG